MFCSVCQPNYLLGWFYRKHICLWNETTHLPITLFHFYLPRENCNEITTLSYFSNDFSCSLIISKSYLFHLLGFGHAIINIATITSLRACFEESAFATLYSLCNTMTTVGLGTLPISFDSLQRHYGVQGALFIFGAILWHTVVIGLLLKPKVPLNKATNETYFRKSGSSLCSRDGIFDIFIAHKSFPILLMVTTLFEANFHGWALYLVPYCQSTGVPSSTAVLLTIIVGVSGFMGKLLMCLLASLDVLHPIMIVLSCFVIALSYAILFAWNSFLGFALVSAVSGFCCGLTSTHIVCECNRIVCKQHFKSGISWTIFCRTISVATGGIVLGRLFYFFQAF